MSLTVSMRVIIKIILYVVFAFLVMPLVYTSLIGLLQLIIEPIVSTKKNYYNTISYVHRFDVKLVYLVFYFGYWFLFMLIGYYFFATMVYERTESVKKSKLYTTGFVYFSILQIAALIITGYSKFLFYAGNQNLKTIILVFASSLFLCITAPTLLLNRSNRVL